MRPTPSGARARLECALLELWFEPDPGLAARILLAPLAPLSRLAATIARGRRRAIARLPRARPPVVVVGNLIVGGAGKTPVVIALAGALQARGWHPGIIARGYRSLADASERARPVPADARADEVGDEPLLLARRTGLPVFAGRDRAAALAALLERHPELDVVLSDDGLQHASLRRDLELVVFDDRGVGNARVLPAGPLREPLDALDTCDAIVLADPGDAIRPRAAQAPPSHAYVFHRRVLAQDVVHLASGRTMTLAEFAALAAHREVTAFAAIAQPQRLFDTLRQIGVAARGIALADHAPISAAWLAGLAGELVVMTEKDAVKCTGFADQRCWYLRVAADLDRGLIDFVEDRLRGS